MRRWNAATRYWTATLPAWLHPPEMHTPSAAELSRCPFLHGMEWRHLEAMASCALRASFFPDEVLFRTGDDANRFYLILSGKVLLLAERPGLAPLPIQEVGAGEVLGWSWLFPPYTWRFSARTTTEVDAYFFSGSELRELAAQDATFAAAIFPRIAQVMLDRLQATRERIASMP